MIKILHVADVHLGRRFRDHPEASETLSNARFETLERVVTTANEKNADILAIAGDLFERTSVKAQDVQRAVRTLNGFTGKAVLVLPGNHDFITDDSDLWSRFQREAEEHVFVLGKAAVLDLRDYDLNAVVYPCPCNAKHSENNMTGWVEGTEKDPSLVHIGLAHGSIEGVSPDFDQRYYPMTQRELTDAGVDIWLLGHTHITWPENPGPRDIIFNPGTPEPDGFDCRHEGRAFFITVDKDKKLQVEKLSTGKYLFVKQNEILENEQDMVKLLNSVRENSNVVLYLQVSGHLEPEVFNEWKSFINRIRESVLELKLDDSSLLQRVTGKQIKKEFPEGSFPHRLLSQLHEENDEEALQMAYQLIQEVKVEN